MLTNREIALVTWSVVLIVFVFTKPECRVALRSVVRAFLRLRIIVLTVLFGGWIGTGLLLASKVDLWDVSLIKDTLIWFTATGLGLLINMMKAAKDQRFFRQMVNATVGISAVVAFFLNIVSFSLIIEMVLQPLLAIAVLLIAFAETDKQYAQLKRFLQIALSLAFIVLLITTVRNTYQQRDDLAIADVAKSFTLSIWLTGFAIPFIYVSALYASYELVFVHMQSGQGPHRPSLRVRIAVIVGLHGRLRAVYAFVHPWPQRVADAATFGKALRIVRDFTVICRLQVEARETERARLIRFSGVDGVDADGRRLDQREFEETRRALNWIATCQMGWYRNQGGRYRSDILTILGDFSNQGLDAEHGIVVCVRRDQRAWYAWRRTISGWVFAVGAAKEPPDLWRYDGPNPPNGFPGSDPMWGASPFQTGPNS